MMTRLYLPASGRRQAAWLFAAMLLLAAPRGAAAQVPLAARDLQRGVVLAAEDIAPVAAADPATPAERRVGWVTRRVIAAGEPLRHPAVAPPEAVRSGEPVDVVWRQGGLELRAKGTATRSATVGERISVRVGPHRRLDGVVAGPGLVRLGTPDGATR